MKADRGELCDYYGPILGQLDNFAWLPGGSGAACCPAHKPDLHRSLSVRFGRDDELLLKCHADQGCTFPAIVQALGRQAKDFFFRRCEKVVNERIAHTFDYVDGEGEVRYQAVRCEPKRFFQRQPDGAGGWTNHLEGVTRIPYRLPELLEADKSRMVLVVEGELKVHALEALGFLATCNAGGAEKWPLDFGQYLVGRAVAILPDNDEKGWRHAHHVARCLSSACGPIRIVELPGVRLKDDILDWLREVGPDNAYRIERLRKTILAAPLWDPHPSDPQAQLAALRMGLARALALSGAL